MIGLAAAVALFSAGLWMLVDWWCDPRPLPGFHIQVDPLRGLRRLLRQAELGWDADRLAAGSLLGALLVGVLVYQVLEWLVPSLFAAGVCVLAPIGYAVLRRSKRRAERQEALVVVLERLRQELETVTLQEALLRLRASPERYKLTSPAEMGDSKVPVLAVHGSGDDSVPAALSRSYVEKATARGVDVRLVEVPSAGHFDVVDPRQPGWATVRQWIADRVGTPSESGATIR